MTRPPCVARLDELPSEKRPRFQHGAGIASRVRRASDATGLTRMGVGVREVEPGFAGTHRHFHYVEEEWVYVLSGAGVVRIGPHRLDVRAGSFVGFPPGPRPHHFIATGDEPLVMLEGGERRPQEDSGWYPDANKFWRAKQFVEPPEPPPPEEGDRSQCAHVDDIPSRIYQHSVDERARRLQRSLHTATGLERQAVRWTRVAAGDLSTAYHTHDRTDEWIYILDGDARASVGDARFAVAAGDLLAHPAGSPAHVMEAVSQLTYLMGGQIDPKDTVTYPEAGMRRKGGRLEPL